MGMVSEIKLRTRSARKRGKAPNGNRPKGNADRTNAKALGQPGIEDLHDLAAKCPRCSLCKFPPLAVVESQRRSSICPSLDEYGFHSHSGSGRVIMANSVFDGRISITEDARDAIFQCTMCGGCDVSCKFSSDIEINEIMFALRARSFLEAGPVAAHQTVLENLKTNGHQYESGSRADWLDEAPGVSVGNSETILLVGAAYALLPDRRASLLNLVRLLQAAGVEFTVLGGNEPDAGTLPLHLGDQAMFDDLARGAIGQLNASGAREIICADSEDFATIQAHWGKIAPLAPRVRHVVEVLDEAIAAKTLKLEHRIDRRVTYHDPCSLGRRSEEYLGWDGEARKIMGQLIVYDPPRPVNRGANGCYDPPRNILKAIPGVELVEMERRREFSYCCGGAGGVPEAYPDFAQHTATERLDEAGDVGADLLVTACPGCEINLGGATSDGAIEVSAIYDLLATSVFGTSGTDAAELKTTATAT